MDRNSNVEAEGSLTKKLQERSDGFFFMSAVMLRAKDVLLAASFADSVTEELRMIELGAVMATAPRHPANEINKE